MSKSPDRPTAVLVLGMHRSGTSALTRVLNLLGVELGGSLMRAAPGNNAKGFWEHQELVDLHDELLETVGSRWDDPRALSAERLLADETRGIRDAMLERVRKDFGGRPLWGVKDPRLCRLLPVWKELLERAGCDARYVLTARHPAEVAASLKRRDGLPGAHAHLSWLEHCLAAERETRGRRRAFVTFDGIMSDWRSEVERIGRAAGLEWPLSPDEIRPAVEEFLDPSLRHHRTKAVAGLHPWVCATWTAWQEAAAGGDPGPQLAAIHDEVTTAAAMYGPWVDLALANAAEGRAVAPAGASAGASAVNRPGTKILRTYERPEGSPRVSIIMPVFNRAELTACCLKSLMESTPDGLYEIILVDNASTDATGELLSCLEGNVKVVSNRENLGFSTACNQGAELASTDLLLFLNNDIEARPGWLEPLLRILDEDAEVAAAGSRLLFPDGTLQHAGVVVVEAEGQRLPMCPIHAHYKAPSDLPAANVPYEYQVLTGACFLVRRGVFEAAGGFDPAYWNGYEDVDLCFRIGQAGWRLVYEPASCLVHHESQSGPERFAKVRANEELLLKRWLGKVPADVKLDASGAAHQPETRRARPYRRPGTGSAAPAALTSILVLTRNQREHTELCLDSVAKFTPEPHEIIVVDNGSTDGTVEWLTERARRDDRLRVLPQAENLGFAGGNNIALAHARGDHVVLLNNDTVVTEGWLSGLLRVMADDAAVGLVGPVTNYASGPQVITDTAYKSLDGLQDFARAWRRDHAGETATANRLVGFCLAARRAVVDDIGGLDTAFGAGNCEDDDWCLRAAQAGWNARIARDVFIHHTGGRTFAGEGLDYAGSMQTNFDVFKAKWGMPADAPVENGYRFADLVRTPRQPRIELPDVTAAPAGSSGPAEPPPVPAGKARLQVGVIGDEEPGEELKELFRRYGHQGAVPVTNRTATVAEWLRDSRFVLLLGPDVLLTDDALEELVTLVHGDASIAAAGPLSSRARRPQRLGSRPRNRSENAAFARKRRRRHRGKWAPADGLDTFCLLLRSEAVAACGGLVNTLDLETALEDLLGRLHDDGHPLAVAKGAWVDRTAAGERVGS